VARVLLVVVRLSVEALSGEGEAHISNETLDPQKRYSVRMAITFLSGLTYQTPAEMGTFVHAVEDEMLCSSLLPDKVPYFNAPIYLQNKSAIGKVDEILGPINEVYFSVKMSEGHIASSFKPGDKVYIAGEKLLPIERFLPKPKVVGSSEYYFDSSVFTLTRGQLVTSKNQRNCIVNAQLIGFRTKSAGPARRCTARSRILNFSAGWVAWRPIQ